MKKTLIIILIIAFGLSSLSQTLILRSGLQNEKNNLPLSDMLFPCKVFTLPTVDLLLSFELSKSISFQGGLKYIPYESCTGINLPAFSYISIGADSYQAIGIPLLIKTTFPFKPNRFKIYITTGIVPTYTLKKESNISSIYVWKTNNQYLYKITEIQRVSDRNFNLLLNTGIGVSYSFKHFDIGLITEYHCGTYTVVTSDIIIEHMESGIIYNYQATSKGSFFTINLEIAYPLFKPKNN